MKSNNALTLPIKKDFLKLIRDLINNGKKMHNY